MRNIRTRVLKGSLWISGGRVGSSLLHALCTILLARILVPSDFGLVALASTMLAILSSITNLSLASALIQHPQPTQEHYHTAWTLGVARGLVLAGVFSLLAWPAARIYGEPRLEDVMYALSSVLVIGGLANPRVVMLQKRLVFWQAFVLDFANNVVIAITSVAIALIYDTYWAIVFGTIAGQAAASVISYWLLPFRPRLSWKHIQELWSFSMWLTLSQVMMVLNYRVGHLLIGGILGQAQLGIYSVGQNLAVAITREAILPLTRPLFPAFSAVAADRERLRRGYQRAQAAVTAVSLPAGLGLALIAPSFVPLALGEKWAPAILAIQVVASSYGLQSLGSLLGPLAMAMGHTRLLFIRSLQMFLMRLPVIILVMHYWGFVGFLVVGWFGAMVNIVVSMAMVRSLIGLSVVDQFRANFRSLVAGAAMCAAVLLLQHLLPDSSEAVSLALDTGWAILTGAGIYVLVTWLLWLAAGQPTGPETEAAEVLRQVLQRTARSVAKLL